MILADMAKIPDTAEPLNTVARMAAIVPGPVAVRLEANGAATAGEDEFLVVTHACCDGRPARGFRLSCGVRIACLDSVSTMPWLASSENFNQKAMYGNRPDKLTGQQ